MDKDLLANIRACENSRSGVERAAKRARRTHPVQTKRMEDIVDLCVESPEAPNRNKEAHCHAAPDNRPGRVRSSDFRALWGEGMPHVGPPVSAAPHSDEPIRWNRVRRRSSSRAIRLPADAAPGDDDVIVCGPTAQNKTQDADPCSRGEQSSMLAFADSMPFDPASFEAELALQSQALRSQALQSQMVHSHNRRPPAYLQPRLQMPPQTSQHPPSLHWHTPVDGRGLPSREMPPALQDQQHSTAPAVMHHMPHRLRHPRPYEPSDMALLHSHGREAQPAGLPPNYSHDAMYRRPVREAPGAPSEAAPAVNLRRSRRLPISEEAVHVEPRRRAADLRHHAYPGRVHDDAELRFRMQELEALEAAFVDLEGPQGDQPPPPPPAPPADWQRFRAMADAPAFNRQTGESRGRRRGWGPGLAEAMMGMLGEDTMGLPPGGHPNVSPHLAGHLNAMRAAFAGMSSGRLPPHLLFSDRDFNEDDYEALLALDDTVENRKGASKDDIEAIPTIAVPAGGLSENGDRRCPICLEDYVPGSTLRRLHCSHQFHQPCLDKWLQQKATCPICQGECRGL